MTTQGHRVFAAIYDRLTGPLERSVLGERRSALLAGLRGEVLDVGSGTGASIRNLGHAARVVAAEPDPAMRRRLAARVARDGGRVEVTGDTAESLRHADASFDAVVFMCVLCTVADQATALAEARRVLRPTGRLVVIEHVRGDGELARWQDRLTPLWSRLSAGCHLGRDTAMAIRQAGFVMEQERYFDPFPAWMLVRPWLEAVAVPAG